MIGEGEQKKIWLYTRQEVV